MNKFTYIVMFYFGERIASKRLPRYTETLSQNKFYFAEKQIEFLKSISNQDLVKVIFVVNQRPEDDINEIQSFFDSRTKEIPAKVSLLFRENKNISYGAWSDAICNDIETNDVESNYYFCLEDDYIPTSSDFVYPFMNKCNETTPYVCCKAVTDVEYPYPSISNGLFLKDACKKVYEKYNFILSLTNSSEYSYSDACHNQYICYRAFLELGYNITDIENEYFFPFFESDSGRIKEFGNKNSRTLIEPILI